MGWLCLHFDFDQILWKIFDGINHFQYLKFLIWYWILKIYNDYACSLQFCIFKKFLSDFFFTKWKWGDFAVSLYFEKYLNISQENFFTLYKKGFSSNRMKKSNKNIFFIMKVKFLNEWGWLCLHFLIKPRNSQKYS